MKYRIYKIYRENDPREYIGHTKQEVKKALYIHRNDSKSDKDGKIYGKAEKLYKEMKDKGCKNFKIELIEEVDVKDKDYLDKRVNEIIRERNTINNGYNK